MDRKNLEIILAIGSIILFVLMLIVIHSTLGSPEGTTNYEGYGYVAALIVFILGVSIAGIKLADIK
jgi:uncharacterized integral membrane protein